MENKRNIFNLKLGLLTTIYSVIRTGFTLPILLATILGAALSNTILNILLGVAFTYTLDHLFTLSYIKNAQLKIQKLGILLAVISGLFMDVCLFCIGFGVVVPKYILIILFCALSFSIFAVIRSYHNE